MNYFGTLILLLMAWCATGQDFTQVDLADGLDVFTVDDIDKDGDMDIIGIDYAPSNGMDEIYILYNDGQDSASFVKKLVFSDPDLIGGIQIVNLNEDEVPEILFQLSDDALLMVISIEDSVATDLQWLGVEGTFNNVQVDFDNDDDTDIVGSNFTDGLINLYENRGSSNLRAAVLFDSEDDLDDFHLEDIDEDADLDIVIASSDNADSYITLLENTGSGSVSESLLFTEAVDDIWEVQIVDADDDGHLDIVGLFSHKMSIYKGNSDLSFENEHPIRSGEASRIWRSFDCGDFDGNGRLDFVIGSNSDSIQWFRNISLDPFDYEDISIARVTPAFSICAADIDGDEDLDFLTTNGDLRLFLNTVEQETTPTLELEQNQMNIFPNPVQNLLNIPTFADLEYHYTLFHINGNIVEKGTMQNGQLQLEHINSGMYFINFINSKSQISRSYKIVKM